MGQGQQLFLAWGSCRMDHVSGGQGDPSVCIWRPYSLCQSKVGRRGRPGVPWVGRASPALSRPVFLPCSASVRLPASSVKLGPKLERYHSAIQVSGPVPGVCWVCRGPHPPGSVACALCSQRSESVKCASPSRTEFLMAPVDVASKRHLFEKELVGQSREGPASTRKVNGSGPPGVCRPLSLGSAELEPGHCRTAPCFPASVWWTRGPGPRVELSPQPSCTHSSGGGSHGLSCADVVRGALWRCQPGPKVEALFSGELAALVGGDVTAQPVDQQDPGVSTAGPSGTMPLCPPLPPPRSPCRPRIAG